MLRRAGKNKRRIYLDQAALSPLSPRARRAMLRFWEREYGNPSAIHAVGRAARAAIEAARSEIARALGIKAAGITFTSGGTEANNLAIKGLLGMLHRRGRTFADMEVVSTAAEHPSITKTLATLSARGVRVKEASLNADGVLTKETLAQALTNKTALVVCSYVNSELGAIASVGALSRTLRAFERARGTRIYFCVDAAQAPLWLSCNLASLGCDFMTLDAGKCGGPPGTGAVASRTPGMLEPILDGGGQEWGVRPGTENTVGIVGFAAAFVEAQVGFEKRARKVAAVRDRAIAYMQKTLPEAVLNGPVGEDRVANNINFSLPGFDTEYAAVVLDDCGVAVSTKNACAAAGGGASAAALAATGDDARARSTLRFTFGEETTAADLRLAINALRKHVELMRTLTK
jgi:cysteine desulfurase